MAETSFGSNYEYVLKESKSKFSLSDKGYSDLKNPDCKISVISNTSFIR